MYDSLSQILKTKKKKNYQLHEALNLKSKFTEDDYLYIHECITITKSVAQTLDILQGGKNVFYGMVMPSLFLLQKKLQSLSEMKWKYCEPIIQCLQNSLESRFNTYFNIKSPESKEAIIAALSHLFFKNKWPACVPSEKHEQIILILKECILSTMEIEVPSAIVTVTKLRN